MRVIVPAPPCVDCHGTLPLPALLIVLVGLGLVALWALRT